MANNLVINPHPFNIPFATQVSDASSADDGIEVEMVN